MVQIESYSSQILESISSTASEKNIYDNGECPPSHSEKNAIKANTWNSLQSHIHCGVSNVSVT